jgi:DedD protein
MADSEASQDANLELKKRARRRLVGAAALALLAVIVLPMVMDHDPKPPAQDIQVRIPGQDAGTFTSRILPGKAPTATPLPPPPAAKPAEPVAETKPEPAKPEAVKPAPVKPEMAKPEPAKPPVKPEVKPEVKPDPKAAAKGAEKPATKPEPLAKPSVKEETARAEAALNGKDQWIVQLGAYKDAVNVKQLQEKMKQMGVAAYTEKFESPQGPRTRVRAGPFSSRDEAEKARERIKKIGVDGSVAQK